MFKIQKQGEPVPQDAPWVYRLTIDGTVILGTTATDVAAAYITSGEGIDKYMAATPDDQLVMRLAYISQGTNWGFLKVASGNEQVDELAKAGAGEAELTAFCDPIEVPVEDLPGNNWRFDMPLMIVATDYAPYTDLPVPTGNVLIVDPSNDLTFLQSAVKVAHWCGQKAELETF